MSEKAAGNFSSPVDPRKTAEKKRFFRSDFSVTGQPSLVDAHD
jgi:hypothetical protein